MSNREDSYHFGVPQFAKINIPTVNEPPVINTSAKLPPVVTPYGNVVVPNITDASADGTGTVTITVDNPNPGWQSGQIMLRALLADGSHIDVQEFGGTASGAITVDTANLKTQDGKAFAVGSVSWQLVRIIPGYLPGDAPIEFAGNTARITPKADMAATLTRTGIEFFRENKTVSVAQVNLVNKIGTGQTIDFNSAYLTGNKVQPIAFSTDLSRAYVAGNGVIYEIDLLTFKLIDTIVVQGGKNIVSLAAVGSLLIVGEGQSYGNGAGNNQLYAMDTNPGSSTYNTFKSIQGTGIESSKLGVAGMTVGPDGQTLVVAVPKAANTAYYVQNQNPGDILILDFKTFNFKTGAINTPVKANLPNDNLSGKAPQIITATRDENRYLVANVADYNRGLSTLTLTRDADGKITSAKMEAIHLSQPTDKISIDRLDIQRAQSAVLVEQDGVEYAIVSDDNYHFLDPYWKAMYEAPTFVFTPSGPPLAVGGSVSAKKVAVGGKLGIVKDPFGQQGDPEFLGATLPLDGYGIVNLSLSEDGKVLIGQLKGTYSGNILSEESLSQKPSQSHAWDVKALIAAALAQPSQDRLRKHISLTDSPNAEQSIADPASEFKGTIGTAFDPEWIYGSVEGNMGDVIGVDLKELASKQLLLSEGKISEATAKTSLTNLSSALDIQLITARMNELTDFSLDPQLVNFFAGRIPGEEPALKLLTKNANTPAINPTIVSRKSADASNTLSTVDADFKETGILFFVPNITDNSITPKSIVLSDKERLLAGEKLNDKFAQLIFHYKDKSQPFISVNLQPEEAHGIVSVTAKDYAGIGAFVGDRPLDNPGYTKFLLKGGVDTTTTDLLDVTRVEQRLKYLGFSAVDTASGKPSTEIIVDGRFNSNEQQALKLFETVVRYTSAVGTGEGTSFSGNAKVTIQYRATVTPSGAVKMEEVAGSFKLSDTTPNATPANIDMALGQARIEAKNNALAAAGYKDIADINGMDGKIESPTPTDNSLRNTTIDWLSAYNAPHWLQFFADAAGGNYQDTNSKLSGWTNKQTQSTGNVFGTSWVFDLMVATQQANEASLSDTVVRPAKLWFAGTGPLGMTLNLGINTDYISKIGNTGNQYRVDSKDVILGMAPDKDKTNEMANVPDNADYINQKWDLGNAKYLAGLLLNPNLDSNYSIFTNQFGSYPNNASGANQQDQAMRDFLAVYSTTQKGENGGGWNNINIVNSDADTIRKALFGNGAQTNGVINSDYLQLGGSAKNFGSQLSTESLSTVMGANANVVYAAWVEPLQKAMTEFEINTPQRIAAFFSQIRSEGNLQPNPEVLIYSAARLAALFPSAFSYNFNYTEHTNPGYRAALALPDRYNNDVRSKEDNAKLFYDEIIAPELALNGGHWTDAVQSLIGNRIYSSDYGTGFERGTGTQSSGEGWKYRGHGQLQLTGTKIIQEFADYVRAHYLDVGQTAAQGAQTAQLIMDNPDVLDTDITLSARSAAWLWEIKRSKNTKADDLNESNITEPSITTDADGKKHYHPGNPYTDTITKRIATDVNSFKARWGNWQKNVGYAYTGGNPYESMRDVLNHIGFQGVNAQGYESQFGITLRKRTPVEIVNHPLMADSINNGVAVSTNIMLDQPMQELLTEAKNTLGFNEGEYAMLIADMPNIAPSTPTVVMIAKAESNQQTVTKHELILGICELLNLDSNNNQVDASPIVYANAYFAVAANDYPKAHTAKINYVTAKVKVLQQPEHGYLEPTMQDGDWRDTRYIPSEGYMGNDFFELQVEGNGYAVKLNYFVSVTNQFEYKVNEACLGKSELWKISTAPNAAPTVMGLDSTIANLTDGAYSPSLPAAFAGANYASSVITFSNLTGAAVGSTQGSGAAATITLDTNAAGHGWYIDYTPYLNEDFLPTSNPNEWVAKAGSDAAGKMDMLSVLLHEYGHALGLEHSADAHDFMSTTLTPGTRRLPSADELTLMAQLVAEAKQNLAGLDGTAVSGNGTQSPIPTPSPIPTLPLGAGFGISFLGLTRRNNNNAGSLFGDALSANAPAQYDIAANPTLVNSELNSAHGWETTGNVAVNPSAGSGQAGGAAVLSEVAGSQTRLNQVFVLGEHDRFLSFTLANSALGDQAAGPDDAFEVALLDANTGLSLLGATGLTRNDAFLNLQANGDEHVSSGITRIDNADGSRTYLVDLGGIAAGTAVNLSFDLIGFGQGSEAGNSQITVRDLRLGVPQTADDNATLAEDTPTVIDALANDINALQPGFAPVIVNAPSHGQVTINPSNPDLGQLGSFSYTPDKDWYGEDTFTYKLSDSRVDSNLATVTLTVTPVNDAPVVADSAVTLAEDATVTIDLLSLAVDVDSRTLASVIVSDPAHGSLGRNTDGNWVYTPDGNYNGTDSFTYKVNDGELDSNLATVTLDITPVNDAPTAGDQSLTADEDTPITGSLLAVAADIDSTLLQGRIVAGPQHGQVSVAADGSFTYTPDANYNGADSFTYKVNDGELDSAIATVMLTIVPVNDAPVASAIAATLLEDGRITLNLLGSASDVDGDTLSVSVGNPQHGQLLKNADGSYTYVPQADYNGEDSFSYSVSDDQLDSGQALVRLTLTAVNDAPVAQDDSDTLDEDHSIHLSIMANDYDVDGDNLNLIIVDQPAHGTLVVNAGHTVSYTPLENWSGEDRFSYKLNDGELDSAIATVRLIVNAVADAPALVLSEVGGASRELFRTGWESVANRNVNSTLLEQRELDGWIFVARPEQHHDEHDDHDDRDRHDEHGSFEIWSSGDLMRDAQGKRRIVSAANGNGSNWLELNDAKGEGHETLGIERRIDTLAGSTYTLSLDLAGHLGYGTDFTRIGIYLDGVKIGSDDSTSPATALNWQTRTVQFIGTGGGQTLRIVNEASRRESNGRGMMIDNIALTETLPANTGFEDGAVPLSAIGALLQDTDGSEILTLTVGAIPVGATLSDGVNRFSATLDNATADVTGWNLGKLTLLPPKDFNGQFALKIVATSTEQANRSQASSEADLLVIVLPVNDAPLAVGASYTLSEGGSGIIDFAGLIGDVDGDVLSLGFTDPKKGKLSKNADGTYTYTPKREFSGTETFTYTVSDGKLATTAIITLTVLPKKDEDEDHHDNGWHHGFGHSEHHGYPSYDDERSAKIIVQSVHADYRQRHDDRQDAIVVNRHSSGMEDKIDWAGQAPNLGKLKKDDWVAEQLTERSKEQSLAELTGLVVKMK